MRECEVRARGEWENERMRECINVCCFLFTCNSLWWNFFPRVNYFHFEKNVLTLAKSEVLYSSNKACICLLIFFHGTGFCCVLSKMVFNLLRRRCSPADSEARSLDMLYFWQNKVQPKNVKELMCMMIVTTNHPNHTIENEKWKWWCDLDDQWWESCKWAKWLV